MRVSRDHETKKLELTLEKQDLETFLLGVNNQLNDVKSRMWRAKSRDKKPDKRDIELESTLHESRRVKVERIRQIERELGSLKRAALEHSIEDDKRYERHFMDAARALLPESTYASILREANIRNDGEAGK